MSTRANGGVRGLPEGDIVRNRADWALQPHGLKVLSDDREGRRSRSTG